MSTISGGFLGGALTGIANADANSERQALLNGDFGTGSNTVADARAQSAQDAATLAQMNAENAQGDAALNKYGVTVKAVSFADIYKSQLLAAVDPSGSGTVTEASLEQQVEAGGGTQAEADTLYKAMDANGDGVVSDQEFENSIPDPYTNVNFEQQLMQMLSSLYGSSSVASAAAGQAPTLDSSMILANLAMQQSGTS